MNEHTALMIPAQAELATLFSVDRGLDPVIAAIRAEVVAHVPDTSTKKGRDAIASLAYKVSRSKTALDEAGKSLTEDAQKQINTVNAERKKMRDQLDALRDLARKPLDDWETAEKARVEALKERLARLEAAAPAEETSASVKGLIQRVEAVELDDTWAEYKAHAAVAKDAKLTELRKLLAATEQREAEQAELARLREEQAKREEEDRLRREAEQAAARLAAFADDLRAAINGLSLGLIGGKPYPTAIVLHDLEERILGDIDRTGTHAESLHTLRLAAIEKVKAAQVQAAAEAEKRAEAERAAAADRARAEAEERAAADAARAAAEAAEREAELKRAADRAAQDERDRLARQREEEEAAQRKREANKRIRNRARAEIVGALEAMRGNATPDAIADALMAGQIPHCEVKL